MLFHRPEKASALERAHQGRRLFRQARPRSGRVGHFPRPEKGFAGFSTGPDARIRMDALAPDAIVLNAPPVRSGMIFEYMQVFRSRSGKISRMVGWTSSFLLLICID
jgi:hypothetical protein